MQIIPLVNYNSSCLFDKENVDRHHEASSTDKGRNTLSYPTHFPTKPRESFSIHMRWFAVSRLWRKQKSKIELGTHYINDIKETDSHPVHVPCHYQRWSVAILEGNSMCRWRARAPWGDLKNQRSRSSCLSLKITLGFVRMKARVSSMVVAKKGELSNVFKCHALLFAGLWSWSYQKAPPPPRAFVFFTFYFWSS